MIWWYDDGSSFSYSLLIHSFLAPKLSCPEEPGWHAVYEGDSYMKECPSGFEGHITRLCALGATWTEPVENCSKYHYSNTINEWLYIYQCINHLIHLSIFSPFFWRLITSSYYVPRKQYLAWNACQHHSHVWMSSRREWPYHSLLFSNGCLACCRYLCMP